MALSINPINLIYAKHAYIICWSKMPTPKQQSELGSKWNYFWVFLQVFCFPSNHLHKIIINYAVILFMTGARVVNFVATISILMIRPLTNVFIWCLIVYTSPPNSVFLDIVVLCR